jgi:hypothetical protein
VLALVDGRLRELPSLQVPSKEARRQLKELESELQRTHKEVQAATVGARVKRFVPSVVRLHGKPRTDLYVATFGVQFLTLISIAFGWSAFESQGPEAETTGGISENSIPVVLLVTLLLQFVVMILDRIFYLRRAMMAKLAMHCFLIGALHVYMFFSLPLAINRSFPSNSVMVYLYLLYILYWSLSAAQVRLAGCPRTPSAFGLASAPALPTRAHQAGAAASERVPQFCSGQRAHPQRDYSREATPLCLLAGRGCLMPSWPAGLHCLRILPCGAVYARDPRAAGLDLHPDHVAVEVVGQGGRHLPPALPEPVFHSSARCAASKARRLGPAADAGGQGTHRAVWPVAANCRCHMHNL